jgi:hypothetical protein
MVKYYNNTAISLRKRRRLINLDQYNTQSLFIIAMIILVFLLSTLSVAASPSSNMYMGI